MLHYSTTFKQHSKNKITIVNSVPMPVLKFDYSILIALDLKHILGLGMTDSILLNDLRNFEKMF